MWNLLKKTFRRTPPPVVAQVPVAGLAYYRAEDLASLMHRGDLLDRHDSLCGKIVEIDPHSEEHRWVKFNIYPPRKAL